jgi:hypothetical protein
LVHDVISGTTVHLSLTVAGDLDRSEVAGASQYLEGRVRTRFGYRLADLGHGGHEHEHVERAALVPHAWAGGRPLRVGLGIAFGGAHLNDG